jgi:hypothetical protein
MKTSEFVQLLQNELILPRDPHVVSRFVELLEENFLPKPPNVGFPDLATREQEPSVSDPTTQPSGTTKAISQTSIPRLATTENVESLSTESEPPDYAGRAMDEEAIAIQESEAK